jgi:hypothetical protein
MFYLSRKKRPFAIYVSPKFTIFYLKTTLYTCNTSFKAFP